jgi:hypothetical protein
MKCAFCIFIAVWRNFIDVGPTTGYVQGILEHFGNYSDYLVQWAGPGHWHDPDQLLVLADSISDDLARSQLALFSILAAPLIIGTDVRRAPPSRLALLTNPDALAVNQDPMGRMGVRLGGAAASLAPTQVWYRPLENGDVAVALYNQGSPPVHTWHTACASDHFNQTTGGYFSSAAQQPLDWCFAGGALPEDTLAWYACNTEDAAGYWFDTVTRAGCILKDVSGPFVHAPGVNGFTVTGGWKPPTGQSANITVAFADVGLFAGASISVYDIWERRVVSVTNATSLSAVVPWQGSAFFRLSQGS